MAATFLSLPLPPTPPPPPPPSPPPYPFLSPCFSFSFLLVVHYPSFTLLLLSLLPCFPAHSFSFSFSVAVVCRVSFSWIQKGRHAFFPLERAGKPSALPSNMRSTAFMQLSHWRHAAAVHFSSLVGSSCTPLERERGSLTMPPSLEGASIYSRTKRAAAMLPSMTQGAAFMHLSSVCAPCK